MTDCSALEMFEVVSKHLCNRGSIDSAVVALLQAKDNHESSPVPSLQKVQDLDTCLEDLCAAITNYALCSQILFEQTNQHDKNISLTHASAFSCNIVALSYLNGIIDMYAQPGVVSAESAMRIKILVASFLTQCVYEHFSTENALYLDLFGPNLENIKNLAPVQHESDLIKNNLTYRAAHVPHASRPRNAGS